MRGRSPWSGGSPAAVRATLACALALALAGSAATAMPYLTIEDPGGLPLTGRMALAIDRTGAAHLAVLQVGATRQVAWGTRADTGWVFEQVVPLSAFTSEIALALDSLGAPQILYGNLPGGYTGPTQLTWMHRDSVGWSGEVVEASTGIGFFSLQLDSAAVPHVAWTSNPLHAVRYAVRGASGWQIENVDTTTGGNKRGVLLALDRLRQPHIAYYLGTGEVAYASRTGAGWSTEVVASPSPALKPCALAIDSLQRPHIAYFDSDSSALRIAVRDGGVWSLETVDRLRLGNVMSMWVTAAGDPRIAYTDSFTTVLRYAERVGGSWSLHTPDQGQCGFPSLALDSLALPHPAYILADRAVLQYAYPSPPGSGTLAGTVRTICDGSDVASAGIRVALQSGGDAVDSVLTDAGGAFSFAAVPLGTWTIVTRSTDSDEALSPDTLLTLGTDGQLVSLDAAMGCRLFSVPLNLSNAAASARAPTLLRLADGTLFAAWGQDPEDVRYSTSLDDGASWSWPTRLPHPGREPSLVLADSGHIAIVTASFDSLGFTASVDGGIRVPPTQVTLEHWRPEFPCAAAGSPGQVHVAWLRYVGPSYSPEGIFYARSTDGGADFSIPAPLGANQLPYPLDDNSDAHIVATPGDSLYACWIYTPSVNANPRAPRVRFVASWDGGLTFSAPRAISDTTRMAVSGRLFVDSLGTVHAMWAEGGYPDSIVYARSTDGGASFQRTSTFTVPGGAGGNARVESFTVGNGGRLYAITSGSYPDFVESDDGGATWSIPVQVLSAVWSAGDYTLALDRTGTPGLVFRLESARATETYFTRKRR